MSVKRIARRLERIEEIHWKVKVKRNTLRAAWKGRADPSGRAV
jgi:hypothetical protein